MTIDTPLVSVGLPVYNGGDNIAQTIKSLLAQDYANFELVISDNASTDRTPEVCREYAKKDPRVRYHRNSTNIGAIKNFNHVFKLSSGEYFMWAGDHRSRGRQHLFRAVWRLWHPIQSVVLCCSQTVRVTPDGVQSEIVPPRLDTRGLADTTRFQLVIWSLSYCYQTYGLIRSDALKRTQLFRDTFGPDTVLAGRACLAWRLCICSGAALLDAARCRIAGDWVRYTAKLNKRLTPWSAAFLYWEMTYSHLRVVHEHIHQPV